MKSDLKTMWNLPTGLHFDNFIEAFRKLAPYLWNSFKMVIPAAIISSILGSLNGFVLAKWKFPGANIIFPLILFGMFIPYQSILIPLVQFMQRIDLYGWHARAGAGAYHLRHPDHHADLPQLLCQHARGTAGSGARSMAPIMLGIYRHILLPISIPAFVVVLIWQFTSAWNDFLFAVVLTSPSELADHGGAEQHGRQPDHRLERADGRLPPGGAADPAGLHLPRPLLPARPDGGGAEGVKLVRRIKKQVRGMSH